MWCDSFEVSRKKRNRSAIQSRCQLYIICFMWERSQIFIHGDTLICANLAFRLRHLFQTFKMSDYFNPGILLTCETTSTSFRRLTSSIKWLTIANAPTRNDKIDGSLQMSLLQGYKSRLRVIETIRDAWLESLNLSFARIRRFRGHMVIDAWDIKARAVVDFNQFEFV